MHESFRHINLVHTVNQLRFPLSDDNSSAYITTYLILFELAAGWMEDGKTGKRRLTLWFGLNTILTWRMAQVFVWCKVYGASGVLGWFTTDWS